MSELRSAVQVISDAITELNNRKGWLDDIYEVIVNNPCSVTVVKDNYSEYDTYTHDIIDNMSTRINNYETYFADIATAITTKQGVIVDATKYEDYDSYILSIPQSGGGGEDTSELEGYLNDVYTALSENTVSVSVTSGDYGNFDQAISDIYDAYDTIITGKDNTIYSLTSTINTYEMDFGAIYSAIVAKGGTCTQNDYSTYAQGVNSIDTSGGGGEDTSELEGYLDDIYDVISKNDVGVTVVAGDYGNFDDNTSAIISALKSQISTLQNQLSTANQTITTYQGYFADIATAITNKGGTVTDQSAYADFDDYVTGIPSGGQTVDQGIIAFGNLKTQISEFGTQGTDSGHSNSQMNLWGDCTNMLRYMGYSDKDASPFSGTITLNLSGLTNATNMFGHVTDDGQGNLSIDTYLYSLPDLTGGIGTSYQGDLSIDLRCFQYVDMDGWKSSFPRNNTGYVRELILRSYNYEQNVGWGGVKALRNKGYTITDGGETRP